jgi:hypothetical protein
MTSRAASGRAMARSDRARCRPFPVRRELSAPVARALLSRGCVSAIPAARFQRERRRHRLVLPPAVRRPEGLALVRPESLPHAGPSWISVTAPNGVVTGRVQVHRDGQRLLIGEVGETRPRRVGDPGRGHCRRWHTYSNLYWVGGLTCRLLRSTCANRAGVSLGATCPRERTQCPPAPAAGAAKSSGYGTALHRRNSNRREAKHE